MYSSTALSWASSGAPMLKEAELENARMNPHKTQGCTMRICKDRHQGGAPLYGAARIVARDGPCLTHRRLNNLLNQEEMDETEMAMELRDRNLRCLCDLLFNGVLLQRILSMPLK